MLLVRKFKGLVVEDSPYSCSNFYAKAFLTDEIDLFFIYFRKNIPFSFSITRSLVSQFLKVTRFYLTGIIKQDTEERKGLVFSIEITKFVGQ
jgi:hypothetical protein